MSKRNKKSRTETTEETGRYVIFFHRNALSDLAKVARDVAGITMTSTAEEAEAVIASGALHEQDTVVLPTLGVAISASPLEQIKRLDVGDWSPVRRIRKEYVFRISPSSDSNLVNVSTEFLRGYRAGVNAVTSELMGVARDIETEILAETPFSNTENFTWGLQATLVDKTHLTGKGVRIAVLDTGFDEEHPDFATRGVVSKNFIAGVATAKDDNGHGTHCLGTVGGPKTPAVGRRYGIATDASLFVGKVMKANGKGNELDILAGIQWALQNKCRIISMSFGKAIDSGQLPDPDYEEIGGIALDLNCLLIAAAGNGSQRPGKVVPVEMPANSKTVLAVGAIDRRLNLYRGSNSGINPGGGGIDLVGPGVEVYSSKPLPPNPHYGNNDGTSMATPHVAGIAALLMEADPNATAEQIWTRLTQAAKRLSLPNRDVGSGLVQIV